VGGDPGEQLGPGLLAPVLQLGQPVGHLASHFVDPGAEARVRLGNLRI
jgi:hypothetical protein